MHLRIWPCLPMWLWKPFVLAPPKDRAPAPLSILEYGKGNGKERLVLLPRLPLNLLPRQSLNMLPRQPQSRQPQPANPQSKRPNPRSSNPHLRLPKPRRSQSRLRHPKMLIPRRLQQLPRSRRPHSSAVDLQARGLCKPSPRLRRCPRRRSRRQPPTPQPRAEMTQACM